MPKKLKPKKEDASNDAMAKLATNPAMNSAFVLQRYTPVPGETDLIDLYASLHDSMQNINKNDTHTFEAMLTGQAHALESIFTKLTCLAIEQTQLRHLESYLRLALKAQSQSRATIEALLNIRNPKVIYANQANIAQGNQQINNNYTTTKPEKIKPAENELLDPMEATHEKRLDRGAQEAPIRINTTVATMETIDRT